ncbi:MAG: hypothetical protein ACR2QZ_11105 [Woeseiaceae bacterium]
MFLRRCLLFVLLFSFGNAAAVEAFVLGGGVEADTEEGLAVTAFGEFGLTEQTWLSAALSRNSAESAFRQDLDTWFADLGIDHWWKPVGVRAGVAYWGDNDTLDSTDLRASVYWRGEKFSISGEYEHRDFDVLFPGTDQIPSREGEFTADGVGMSARIDITDAVNFGLSGISYDYDVDLRLDSNRPLLQLLSFSRLSLINSLVDHRATASLAVDVGERSWHFSVATWKGEVDGGRTKSATVRFLTPMNDRSDIEFALGVDDSELYGNVTFFSVFLFFYGGS